MRTSYSLAFYCRPSKTTKTGEAPIELSISLNGKRVFLNLPVKVNPSEFNRKKKPEHVEALVNTFRQKAQEVIADILLEGLPLTAPVLRDRLQTGGTRTKTVEGLFNDYLKFIKPRVGKSMTKGVYRKYELVRDYLCRFFGPDREIITIKPYEMESLYEKLKSEYKTSTSASLMTKVKTVFTFAHTNGFIKNNVCGLIKINKGTPRFECLTDEEIKRLEATPLPKNLELTRVASLVQLYTGTAFCDAQHFDIKNCRELDGVLIYEGIRQKTKIPFIAIVIPKIKQLLEPYGGKTPLTCNQVTNRRLKEIGYICGIDKELHTHLFRKTYATYLVRNGIEMSVIAKCLGHKTSQTTQKIYAFIEPETVVSQAKSLFNNF